MTPADPQNTTTDSPILPEVSGEETDGADSRPVPESGEDSFDFGVFLALVKETAHHLRRFRPPDGLKPGEPPQPTTLSQDMVRDLGAASLEDFYSQALEGRRPEEPAASGWPGEFFPRGPESIRLVLTSVETEITRLTLAGADFERSWPSARPGLEEARRSLSQRLARLKETRAGLMAAARLWPRLKAEADKWPETVKNLWRKTKRLEEAVAPLLVAVRTVAGGEADVGRVSPHRALTQTVVNLRAESAAARQTAEGRVRWAEDLDAVLVELDQLLDQVVKSPAVDKDWGRSGLKLSERLSELETGERTLAEESMRHVLTLSRTLSSLAGLEKTLSATDDELRGRLDLAGQAATVLWRTAMGRRREMALLYFALPHRLGRPAYLEKMFLGLALGLGRTQARLEDLRRRLALGGERLPETKKPRAEAENLMARLGPPLPRTGDLKRARRRLSVLLKAAGQSRSLSELKAQLARARQSGREADRERNRDLVENRRMRKELESANSALRLATQEKARLEEFLSAARQGLEAVSQVKPKLLKAFTDKAEYLLAAERDRWAARLTRHRTVVRRLVAMRQVLRSELGEAGLKLTSMDNERRFLGAQLAEVRARNRDVEATGSELRSRAAGLEEENASLAARMMALDAAKSDLDRRFEGLTGEKAVLEESEARLADQVAQLTERAGELDREREDLAGRLGELEARVRDDLGPLIQCLTAALWRSEAHLRRARAALPRVRDMIWREAELREANLRLAAAAREVQLVESARAERVRLEGLLTEQGGELTQVRERLAATETVRSALDRRAREQETAAVRMSGRAEKLARSLDALKRRYRRRLEEARITEGGLRDLIEQQKRELAAGSPPPEVLLQHFFDQAAESFGPGDKAGRDLALALQADSQTLLAEAANIPAEMAAPPAEATEAPAESHALVVGVAEVPADGQALPAWTEEASADGQAPSIAEKRRSFSPREFIQLQARLDELQPLTAFLAQSFVANVAELAQVRRERAALAEELGHLRSTDLVVDYTLAQAREAELADLRGQAFALARERDELRENLAGKEDDLVTLKQELAQADRDLTENDGRLEAAWAALNYLGTRAGDTLGNMKGKLEAQARQVDSLSLELKRRAAQAKTLEDRQDKLALLYWALISKAVRDTAASAGPAPVPALAPASAMVPIAVPMPFAGSPMVGSPAPQASPAPAGQAPGQRSDQRPDQREVLTQPFSANYK